MAQWREVNKAEYLGAKKIHNKTKIESLWQPWMDWDNHGLYYLIIILDKSFLQY